jgi:hypothetical protein
MSAAFSCVRNARTVALAALVLSALTVGASAGDGAPPPRPIPPTAPPTVHPIVAPPTAHPIIFAPTVRDHRGETAKLSPAGTYDSRSATVRDHRSNAGSGAASTPAGHSPK